MRVDSFWCRMQLCRVLIFCGVKAYIHFVFNMVQRHSPYSVITMRQRMAEVQRSTATVQIRCDCVRSNGVYVCAYMYLIYKKSERHGRSRKQQSKSKKHRAKQSIEIVQTRTVVDCVAVARKAKMSDSSFVCLGQTE